MKITLLKNRNLVLMNAGPLKKLIVLFFLSQICFAQKNAADSLLKNLQTQQSDTAKVNTFNALSYQSYIDGDYDGELQYAREALLLAQKINWKKGIGASYTSIGSAYDDQGDIQESLKNYHEALSIYEEIDNRQGIGICFGRLGTMYEIEGNYSLALDYYFKSLKIIEESKDNNKISIALSNIGNIYRVQGDFVKSLGYYFRGLKLVETLGNQRGIIAGLTNIGNVYFDKADYQLALDYYLKALKIAEEVKETNYTTVLLGNIGSVYFDKKEYDKSLEYNIKALNLNTELGRKAGIVGNLGNIGNIYKVRGDEKQALDYYFRALDMSTKLGIKSSMAINFCHIGSLYTSQKKYALAREYLDKSLNLSKEIMSKVDISVAYAKMAKLDSATGNYRDAFSDYRMHIIYRDSLRNEEMDRKTTQIAMQYDFDKKQSADSIIVAEERKVNTIKFAEEKNQRIYLYAVLILIGLFAVFMYNRFRVTSKQKQIIEQKEKETHYQKQVIEEKHKEIRDSINYAERIQRSLLASDELLTENLSGILPKSIQRTETMAAEKNYFVYFNPKDIVSGDFYWASKLANNNFALITADSTGHGVPGAIMSILNIACLNEAIKEGNTDPESILNETRKKVIETLKRDGSDTGGKDGMDCSLLVFEPLTQSQKQNLDFTTRVHIASAYNPVWIIRDRGEHAVMDKQMIEIKADKMPVGKHDRDHVSFSRHTVELKTGDVIYTLTDGFPDQFGGEKGKKYMIKNLKETLLKISHLPMHEQYEYIASEFSNWKGSNEQIDDVTVVGVKI